MSKTQQSIFVRSESFKNIVRLASKICGTKAAMINGLDDKYQWTLYNIGWDNIKIPKKDSICQFTPVDTELLYIPNTDEDKRLQQVEAVQKDQKIKFYAGVGFQAPNGIKGTLCVINDEPKELTDMQKEALEILASEVEARLDLISQRQKVQAKNQELEKKRLFLKNSLDILLIVDSKTLEIDEVHTEIDKKFGYDSEELEGNRITQYIDSTDYERRLHEWRDENNLGIFNCEIQFKTKSGDNICLMLNTSLVNGKLYITGRDISKRKSAEYLILKEKNLNDGIIENLPGIFCLIKRDGTIKRFNKNLKSITEYKDEEIEGNLFYNFISKDIVDFTALKINEIFYRNSARAEITMVSKSGKKIPFLFTGFSQNIENKQFAVLIGIDISEEQKAVIENENKEKRLQQAYQRLKNAQHVAKMGSWEWIILNEEFYWSEEVFEILQYDKNKHIPSLELLFKRLPPQAKEKMESAFEMALKGSEFKELEHDVILPDGKIIHVYERGETIFDNEGRVVKIIGSIQDVTEQKKTEIKLKKALQEKEVMVMEVHHRVKNNLAVVSGLLQLEAGFEEDSLLNNSLLKSISRIKSMAAIHEHLYKSKSFSNISFDNYIRELVQVISSIYHEKSKNIEVHIHTDTIELNINQAIPCALILNEVISNSFKHAFNDLEQGSINIEIRLKGNIVDVIVTDNGVGVDANIEPEKSSTLGFTLLEILSSQLEADYNITSNNGLRTQLQFKREQNIRGSSGNIIP